MKKRKKLRHVGEITQDMEYLLQELVYGHKLQIHEVMGIQYAYLRFHCPEAIEQYEDGTEAVWFYGHQDYLKEKK